MVPGSLRQVPNRVDCLCLDARRRGSGDEQDKLVTVDVNPKSENYGKVVASVSVGGRNEAHHSDFTDDRRFLWAGGLDTSKIFIFDVHTDPAKPKLVQHHRRLRRPPAAASWVRTPSTPCPAA